MVRSQLRSVVTGTVTALAVSGAVIAAPATEATAVTSAFTDYTFSAAAGATLADVRRIVRADAAHAAGWTGKGVGIALIDTGVVPVDGLTSGNVINGPDLSLESQVPSLARRDTYGHGTHMAGIMGGRNADKSIIGIAPDAKLTSIKVGMANGAVDITQMMAAIDWVVAHRNDDSANPIRVLNLSYGTDSIATSNTNPLSLALQNARKAGILVVVAAGNTGNAMTNPAYDPFMMTVAATDPLGTTNPANDTVAPFSSTLGVSGRRPDILAPGKSIVSLRNPGSFVDANYPSARVGEKFFKGSGTSQAAAVVSGAAALYFSRFKTSTPDQTKANLLRHSIKLASAPALEWGSLDVQAALTGGWDATVYANASDGSATLDATRGTSIVTLGGVPLTGERDIFGPLDVKAWAAASTARTSWSGGNWMGRPWTGTVYTTVTDGQANWSGRAWSGRAWSGRAWSDLDWSGASWSGRAWSNTSFSGRAWSGTAWSAASWLSGDGNWLY
jgi:serine protease AprX